MLPLQIVTILLLPILLVSQVTKIDRRNVFLSRGKRYLSFPMNSNFVISLSYLKNVMQVQPAGFIAFGECDVPFALPSDTRLFKKNRRNHYIQRRQVYSEIEEAFWRSGLNGTACLKRMICETRHYIDMKGKSIAKDLLSAVFTSLYENEYLDNSCENTTYSDCTIPIFNHFLNSIFPTDY